jgi:hypothetical protein
MQFLHAYIIPIRKNEIKLKGLFSILLIELKL